MICPRCKMEVKKSAFCSECGAPLVTKCAVCEERWEMESFAQSAEHRRQKFPFQHKGGTAKNRSGTAGLFVWGNPQKSVALVCPYSNASLFFRIFGCADCACNQSGCGNIAYDYSGRVHPWRTLYLGHNFLDHQNC